MHRLKFRDAVLGSLLSVSLASGCMQHCPKGSPLLSRHGYVSGMMLKRADNGFKIENVLMSGPRKVHMICLTKGFESNQERNEAEFRKSAQYLDYLNLKNPRVIAMIENNIFIFGQKQMKTNTLGGYIDGKTLFGLVTQSTLKDSKGNVICSQKNCASHDVVFLRSEKENPDPAETLIHEHLHDAWCTVLPEESKRSFLTILRRILSIGGSDQDVLFQAIRYLSYDARTVMVADFVAITHPLSPPEKQRELALALTWFYKFRSLFARKALLYGKTVGHTREKFIEREGYPMAFEYSPDFMNEFYTPIISDKGFEKLRIGYKSSHLSSREDFEKLVPVLESFVRHLLSRPREYWKELKKIETEKDADQYLKRKYGKHVS